MAIHGLRGWILLGRPVVCGLNVFGANTVRRQERHLSKPRSRFTLPSVLPVTWDFAGMLINVGEGGLNNRFSGEISLTG